MQLVREHGWEQYRFYTFKKNYLCKYFMTEEMHSTDFKPAIADFVDTVVVVVVFVIVNDVSLIILESSF